MTTSEIQPMPVPGTGPLHYELCGWHLYVYEDGSMELLSPRDMEDGEDDCVSIQPNELRIVLALLREKVQRDGQ